MKEKVKVCVYEHKPPLTLCMLCTFSCFFFCCRLTFSKIHFFFKYSFRNTIRVSNHFDQEQNLHSVGPDLGPKCLQVISAEAKKHPLQAKSYRVKCSFQWS